MMDMPGRSNVSQPGLNLQHVRVTAAPLCGSSYSRPPSISEFSTIESNVQEPENAWSGPSCSSELAVPAGVQAATESSEVKQQQEASVHDQLGPPLPNDGYLGVGAVASPNELAKYQHDPIKWKEAFSYAGDGTSCPDMHRIRALRVLIWLQTERAIDAALAYDPKLRYPLASPAPRTEVVRSKRSKAKSNAAPQCEVSVEEMDVLVAAQRFSIQGEKVAVLNMAAAGCPGGGFRSGAGAQEENLHRRTDAYRFTDQQSSKCYPIPDDACLVSQGVTVMRGSEKDGYPFLDDAAFKICMISCAAPCYPMLNKRREYSNRRDRELMQTKVSAILTAAVTAGCDAVVLSAFGCGAFANPPEVVARLFKEELDRSPLKRACFCIFNDHNAGHDHNPRGNLLPFQEVFDSP